MIYATLAEREQAGHGDLRVERGLQPRRRDQPRHQDPRIEEHV